ncbi:SMP-30/gluconolactonase/LRE family protein [Bordetella bronchialis]|uniref:SMP-30/gluconolactonase/LRE family protein n=1 Tax=Bordetella bronchialis TaxID=463025 RepID=UPI000AB2512C|nr:SMP-30/gluconolactonase/LRE family protein [Bordetella bronchialis]
MRIPRLFRHIGHSLLLVLVVATSARAAGDFTRYAAGLQFPEGTVFVGDELYFVDYGASSVLRLAGGQAVLAWSIPGCGANGLLPFADAMLVACYDGGAFELRGMDGSLRKVIDRDSDGQPLDRPNDLAADGHGGAYVTASGGDGTPGRLYHLDATLDHVVRVADGIRNANGVALSPDGSVLYLGESATDTVWRYDVAPDGTLSGKREFLRLDERLSGSGRHTPDGLRTDAAGRLFVSLYNGDGFAVFAPDGALLATRSVPGSHHSNLAISPDGKWVYGTIDDAVGALYRVPNPVARQAGHS